MPGGLMSLFAPPNATTLLHVLYGYVVPIALHAVWASLVVIDLAQRPIGRGRGTAWCLAAFGLPFVGSAAYLTLERGALAPVVRILVVAGGVALVAAAYVLSFALIG